MSARRRWPRRLLVALVLLAAIWFSRALWVGPLVRAVAPTVALGFGVSLEVDEASGDGVSGLVLGGVRAAALGERGALRRLDAERVELEFDLFELLGAGLPGLHEVRARALDLELDFGRDPFAAEVEDLPEPESEPSDAELLLPRLDLRDSRVLLVFADDSELELDRADLGTTDAGALDLDAGAAEYRGETLRAPRSAASTTVHLDAGGVTIEQLRWGDVLRARDSVLRWEDGLDWRAALEVLEGSVELEGSYRSLAEGQDWSLDLRLDARDADLERLGQLWPTAEGLAGEVIALEGSLAFDSRTEDLVSGELEARVDAFAFEGSRPMRFDGALVLADGFVRSEAIELSSPDNVFRLSEVELPLASGALREHLSRGRLDLEVDVRDLPGLLGRPDARFVGHAHHLVLWATLEDGTARIERGRFVTAGGELIVQGGTVRDDPARGPAVAAELFANFEDLTPLGELFGAKSWAGSLSGRIDVVGNWPNLTATSELSGSAVSIAGIELGEVEAVVESDGSNLVVPRLESRTEANTLTLSGAVALRDDGPEFEDVRLVLSVDDLARLVPRPGFGGSVRVLARVSGAVGALSGDWTVTGQELALGRTRFDRLTARGELDGDRLELAEVELTGEGSTLSAAGSCALAPDFSVLELALDRFELARGEADLRLLRPTTLMFGEAFPRFRAFELDGSAGGLNLYLHTEPAPEDSELADALRFGIRANNLRPMPFLEGLLEEGFVVEGVDGVVDGRIRGDDLEFTSDLSVARFEVPLAELAGTEFDHPWNLEVRAKLVRGVLDVEAFRASSGETSQLRLKGRAPFRPLTEEVLPPGELALTGSLAVPELMALRSLVPEEQPWPSGRLELAVDLSGDWEHPRGTIDLDGRSIDLVARDQELFRGAQIGGRVMLGERTGLERVRIFVPAALSLRADGEVLEELDFGSLAEGRSPFTEEAEIRLDAGLIVEDSSWMDRLHRALGGAFLRRFGGRMAATLDLSGTLRDPHAVGQLELDGGTVKLSPELPALEELSGAFFVDGERFEVQQLRGRLGGEEFHVTGHVDLGAEPQELSLSLIGENLLFYRSAGVKVRSDADLIVGGSPDAPRVEGRLNLTDGRFVRRFDFLSIGQGGGFQSDRAIELFSFRDPPLSETRFDVRVTASEPFRVDNNVARARLRPDLRLTGTGELPELVGTLYVDGGKVKLPANDLFLRAGTIRFDRSPSMIPQLELTLYNRIRGYEVTVTVNGPYDDPEVLFSSSPPLGSEDLAALVWAGQDPGEGLTSRTGLVGAQAVGAYIVQDLLTRMFSDESTESDESFFDRFELLLGRDTTQDGGETIEMTYRVAEDVWSEAGTLYLATERDVYAHVNFGLRFVFRFR